MKRTVRILKRAQNDLEEIQRYIRRDRPDKADQLVENLLGCIESLEEMPDRGVVPRDERLASLGYRVLIEQEYLVFYKVLRSQVRVYRVVHGRRRYGEVVGHR
jgi:toxin ParE1/3/4